MDEVYIRTRLDSLRKDVGDIKEGVANNDKFISDIYERIRIKSSLTVAVLSFALFGWVGQTAINKNLSPNQIYVNELQEKGYNLEYDRPALLVFGDGYYFRDKDNKKYRIVGVTEGAVALKGTENWFNNNTQLVPRR